MQDRYDFLPPDFILYSQLSLDDRYLLASADLTVINGNEAAINKASIIDIRLFITVPPS